MCNQDIEAVSTKSGGLRVFAIKVPGNGGYRAVVKRGGVIIASTVRRSNDRNFAAIEGFAVQRLVAHS